MRKKAILLGTCIILFIGALSSRMGHFKASSDKVPNVIGQSNFEYNQLNTMIPEEEMKTPKTSNSDAPLIKVDTDPDSYSVLVNRHYLISRDYVPADLVVPDIPFSFIGIYEKSYMRQTAADALEKLFQDAKSKGHNLYGVSAYRSYERQQQIYNNNVRNRGTEKTDRVSAIPGSSEHQTGLSIDVSCKAVDCALEQSFGKTEEGKWLRKNCYKYGFIIRYPKKKSKITGYSYEPWHIRYVGLNLAKYLHENNMTLEEYYQLTTVDNQVAVDPVQDTDSNIKDDKQMMTAPTPKPETNTQQTSKTTERKDTTTRNRETTPAPTKAAEPADTPKPTKTPKPVKTPKPAKTPKPEVTPKPTKEPVATNTPEGEVTTSPSEGTEEDLSNKE